MEKAVILSTARTPIGKAYRGSFNDTDAPTLASFSIKASIEKSWTRSIRSRRCDFRCCCSARKSRL